MWLCKRCVVPVGEYLSLVILQACRVGHSAQRRETSSLLALVLGKIEAVRRCIVQGKCKPLSQTTASLTPMAIASLGLIPKQSLPLKFKNKEPTCYSRENVCVGNQVHVMATRMKAYLVCTTVGSRSLPKEKEGLGFTACTRFPHIIIKVLSTSHDKYIMISHPHHPLSIHGVHSQTGWGEPGNEARFNL